ncbi:MAG: hypothetical protein ABGZ17_02725, partial [Planctomycetaceae bacterium]
MRESSHNRIPLGSQSPSWQFHNQIPWLCAVVAALCVGSTSRGAQRVPDKSPKTARIAFHQTDERHPTGSVVLTGLLPADLTVLRSTRRSSVEWQRLLNVSVFQPNRKDLPPMLGNYRLETNSVRFEPRFILKPGLRYRVVYHPAQLHDQGARPVVYDFQLPVAKPGPATQITHVYPTGNRLPENQLKFYIHFSTP